MHVINSRLCSLFFLLLNKRKTFWGASVCLRVRLQRRRLFGASVCSWSPNTKCRWLSLKWPIAQRSGVQLSRFGAVIVDMECYGNFFTNPSWNWVTSACVCVCVCVCVFTSNNEDSLEPISIDERSMSRMRNERELILSSTKQRHWNNWNRSDANLISLTSKPVVFVISYFSLSVVGTLFKD